MRTILFSSLFFISACSGTYFNALEAVGIPKRDLLAKRINAASDSQQDAKEQFADALEAFRSVVAVRGGDLETKYNKLNYEYEQSVESASDIRNRIKKIETVAEALFEEWEEEIRVYQNPAFKRQSAKKLEETTARYNELLRAMNAAASKADPVLVTLRDQVMFLKHNLNSRSILALEDESDVIERDISKLVSALERSIDEAAVFIEKLK